MRVRCSSGKRVFESQQLAEDVLIESWIRNDYVQGQAPVGIYRCDDCGYYHFTSKGPPNPKLSEFLASDQFKRQREAARWSEKFKRK
jgi:hypothetical protein